MEKINLDKEFFDWYHKESANDYNASTLYERYGTISKKLAKHFFERRISYDTRRKRFVA